MFKQDLMIESQSEEGLFPRVESPRYLFQDVEAGGFFLRDKPRSKHRYEFAMSAALEEHKLQVESGDHNHLKS